ncbi:MAG: hypothetical protein CFE41_19350 [Burkholderiales bacterium PBB2]|nr:MAG: hypothetical protein CFE41_19350 [Burkholderiales bacterium PBB2]
MDRRRVLLSLAAPALGASPLRASPRQISYPVFGGPDDPFRQYCIEVLKLAIAHCGVSYSLQAVSQPVGQERAIRALVAGQGSLNLLWSMTSEARERDLLPLRIPLDRGLMGWRLLLVRKQDQARFARVRQLDGLRGVVAGQMHDWPDTQILRANGLQVGTGSSYENLFAMLQRGRTDFFPRSVLEIEDDLRRFGGPYQLAIAPGLMLRYPTAFYFFVSPREPGLAEDLSRGLDRIVSEGLWQALFAQHMRPQFKRLALHERQVLNLHNPLLPTATPLRRAELWEEPGRMSG